jgi:hypothetical protein
MTARTVPDIEEELVRIAKWRVRCPTCGSFSGLVRTPHVDLQRLANDPGGDYADGVMAMLREFYPPENQS